MYTIVYLNTATPVFASRKFYSSLKHRRCSLLRTLIPLKNRYLHRLLRASVYRYRLRIKYAIQQQARVCNDLMRGGL